MDPQPLELVRTFVLVAAHHSFARSAHELRITPSAVSRQIKALERYLGAQLFYRTTRTMTLTDAGRTYLDAAREAMQKLGDAAETLSRAREEVQGELRLSTPVAFGRRFIAPALPRFVSRHPKLSLELTMTDDYIDLAAEAIDVAVRVGRLEDSSLRSRKLASNRRILVASPDYVARRGSPKSPDDLRKHSCIALTVNRDGEQWRLSGDGGSIASIKPRGALRANNGDAVLAFAQSGCGVAFLSSMMVQAALADGSVVRILPTYAGPETGVNAVFRADPELNPRIRALIDYLAEVFEVPSQGVSTRR